MRTYYERDGHTILHGDCADLDIPPYELFLTDPPYGQAFESGKALGRWGAIIGDKDAPGVVERLGVALKSLRRNRHVYIFKGRLDLSGLPLAAPVELVWDKQIIGMGDLTQPFGPQHETIVFATYETSAANRDKGYGGLAARMRKGSVLRSTRPNSRGVKNHPTEKPTDILRQMIESSSVMGDRVVDPFAGSGSTGVAAALSSRLSTMVEADERYCETAAKRLDAVLEWLGGCPC